MRPLFDWEALLRPSPERYRPLKVITGSCCSTEARQVRITAFGEDLLHQLRPALEGLDKLWRPRTKATASQIVGTVRISAPHSMGSRAVLAAWIQ